MPGHGDWRKPRSSEKLRLPVQFFAFSPSVVSLLAALAIASTAHASPSYPAAVAEALDLPCPPACTLCHASPSGGIGTAVTSFGTSARIAGLSCCAPAQLPELLQAMEADQTDSDQDGEPNIAELMALTDPNRRSEDAALECMPGMPDASTGCSVLAREPRPNGAPLSNAWLIAACVAALGVRRRSSQRSTRRARAQS